jgi:hypothetical protein
MKTAWTYVFMFVSVPPVWLFHEAMLPGFGAGSNGSSPTDDKNNGVARWPEPEREQGEACPLPNHLFWTWFVDNPCRNLKRTQGGKVEH